MSTIDLQPLTVLLAHAERQRDLAMTEHQRARLAAEAAAEQSNQLLAYRCDYEQRWHGQFQRQGQGQIELVRCYHQFMEKLTLAVEHQARVTAHVTNQANHAERRLRDIELRCASVRKLIEARQRDIRLIADRREQKQTDEQAMRAAWSQRTASRHI